LIALAPHLAELAFDAGAGDQVIATVEYSDRPPAAQRIARVGDAFRVDFERIVALRPDAILVWESGTPPQVVERLRTLHLPLTQIATYRLGDVAEAVRQIGRLAGTSAVANGVARRYEDELAELREQYRGHRTLTVFLQVNDQPLYTVNDKQIMSQALALCGGKNIFGGLSELAPAVSVESVLAANPDVIISVDDTVPNPLAQWQQWKHLRAVAHRNVFPLAADDLARPTPRLISGIRALCEKLDEARERAS
jgi:iron complex transport system substrate-binding protein